MKKIVLIVMLLIAQQAQATTVKECSSLAELAQKIMEARQVGVPMAKVFQVVGDNQLYRAIVVAAYEQPAFMVEDIQQKAIRDFYDNWFLACIKSMSRQKRK